LLLLEFANARSMDSRTMTDCATLRRLASAASLRRMAGGSFTEIVSTTAW
jgi:hypothetical protein